MTASTLVECSHLLTHSPKIVTHMWATKIGVFPVVRPLVILGVGTGVDRVYWNGKILPGTNYRLVAIVEVR